MASSGKKKTTMAKLARESRLQERRLDKQARKDARRQAASAHPAQQASDPLHQTIAESVLPEAEQRGPETIAQPLLASDRNRTAPSA
jgi:hypothetical protein